MAGVSGGEECGCDNGSMGPQYGQMAFVGGGQGEFMAEQQYRFIGYGGEFSNVRRRRDFTCLICTALSLLLALLAVMWCFWPSANECEIDAANWQYKWNPLTRFYTMVFPPCGIILNPLSGILLDKIGLTKFSMMIALILIACTMLEPVQDITVQKVYIVAVSVFYGVFQNLMSRWPVHFGPPDLYGVFSGTQVLSMGFGGMVLMSLLPSQSDKPTTYLSGLAALLALSYSGLLLVRGVPRRPPRNKYDSVKLLMGHNLTHK